MNLQHWNYFLALCDDTVGASRYVEFHAENFKTYSIEFARLYLASGSEVDVVAKQLCLKCDAASKADNINAYRATILAKFPDLPCVRVDLPRFVISLTPWKDWATTGQNPFWWHCYNEVKHKRDVHFQKANLENTLNALAGLYVLLTYLYGNELATEGFIPMPTLFRFDLKYLAVSRGVADMSFTLPGMTKPIFPWTAKHKP